MARNDDQRTQAYDLVVIGAGPAGEKYYRLLPSTVPF